MLARGVALVAPGLLSLFLNFGCGFACQGGPRDSVVSSPKRLASDQAVAAPATNVARTDDSRAPHPELRVKWEAGKLSLDAEKAPLSEVLEAVSHQTGIQLVGAQGLSNPVSLHCAGRDLLQALQELLTGIDYAVVAGPAGSASPQGIRVVIFNGVPDSGRATSLVKAETNATTAPVAVPQEEKLTAIETASSGRDRETLRKYLQDADPAVQAAAFYALAAQDKAAAAAALLADARGADQLITRLQALQLLTQSGSADEKSVMAALGDAVKDPDPTLSAFAVQALLGRSTEGAIDVLREALYSADASTKLMVIENLGVTEAGLPLLREALSDPDETVSNAAATLLHEAEARAGATGEQ